MRTIHMPHFHKPDWHHMRDQFGQMIHDPVFWVILIVTLMIFAILFLMAISPALPESEPYPLTHPFVRF